MTLSRIRTTKMKYLFISIILLSSCFNPQKELETSQHKQEPKIEVKENSNFRRLVESYDDRGNFLYNTSIIKIGSCEYVQTYCSQTGVRLIPKTDCKFCLSHKK